MKLQVARLTESIGKRIINPIVEFSGLFERTAAKLGQSNLWIIITYHRVTLGENLDPFNMGMGMCTDSKDFEAQLSVLKQHFQILPACEVIDKLNREGSLDAPIVSINFDDGYLDNHDVALPILKKLGVPATLFYATGALAGENLFWWDRVVYAVHRSQMHSLNTRGLGLPDCPERLKLSDGYERQSLSLLLDALWSVDRNTCLDTISSIEEQLECKADPQWAPRMMEKHIKSFSDAGMELGAHTISHHNLTLLDERSLQRELLEPKASLEAICGKAVRGFAYPAGIMSKSVKAAVQHSGYEYAMGTDRAFNTPPVQDFYDIPRMVVGDNNLLDFKRCFQRLARKYV